MTSTTSDEAVPRAASFHDDAPALQSPAKGAVTTAEDAVANNATASDRDRTSTTDTDSCVFCLETVSKACIARPCGHRCFDFLCLTSWLLEYHPTCPLCKGRVETVEYGGSFEHRLDIQTETNGKRKAVSSSVEPPQSDSHRSRPRRRQHADAASTTNDAEAQALAVRRRVYRLAQYARHVGATRRSRHYQALTPDMFQHDPDLTSRARAFIRRELMVLWSEREPVNANANANANATRPLPWRACRTRHQLIEYIVLILKSVDVQSSAGAVEDMLAQDLGGASIVRHFMHELRSFLRSPYMSVASWDRHVQYGPSLFADGDIDDSTDSEAAREERRVRRRERQRDIADREERFRPPTSSRRLI